MPLFHECPKSTYCSCVRRGWPAQFAMCFLTIFWFPFLLWLAPLRGWALLDGGLYLSSTHPFFCYHLLPYHSIIPAAKLFAPILLGLFGPVVYFSPNGLVWSLVLLLHHWRALMFHLFSLRRPWPICFPWASLALFLTLYCHGLLLSSLGFLSPLHYLSSLGLMGLPSTPYFLYFHYFELVVAHSYFSTSYTAHGLLFFFSLSGLL